jgi:hypothetical protein
MAYYRETKSKHTGAVISRTLVYTAKDKRIQAERRDSKYGLPTANHWGCNRRENWSIRNVPNPDDLRDQYRNLNDHLAAYRARYYANLRVKHLGASPVFAITVGSVTVWNWGIDLDLDQWAISDTIHNIRWCERVARAYRIYHLTEES